jgi:peptidoglycan hydrolase CwlO-like protein
MEFIKKYYIEIILIVAATVFGIIIYNFLSDILSNDPTDISPTDSYIESLTIEKKKEVDSILLVNQKINEQNEKLKKEVDILKKEIENRPSVIELKRTANEKYKNAPTLFDDAIRFFDEWTNR